MSGLSHATRLAWAACLLVVLLASLFGRPEIPIDETRYLGVAWEMFSGGDWLLLHQNGAPYPHKPPLLFWLIGLGWSVFGVNTVWPRVVAALFSFASLLLVAAIAHRLWPHEEGVGERAGWFLLGGVLWLFFSTAIMFDVMLTAFVLLALLAALRAQAGEARGTWGLFGIAVGLGILAKGPVILLHVLPPLLLAPMGAGTPNPRNNPGKARWYGGLGAGLLLGAAIALAWAVPAALAGGEAFREAIFWNQTAGRISGALAHRQPAWFYLALLPLLLFPWFFWGGTWRLLRAALKERGDPGVRFCLLWILTVFAGFSLSGGKQIHYLLPLLPAFLLLPARGGRSASFPGGHIDALPLALLFAALGGLFALSPDWAAFPSWLSPYADAFRRGGLALGMLALLSLRAARGRWALPRVALLGTAFSGIVLLVLLPPLAPVFDMTPLSARLKALQDAGVPLAHTGAYNDQYHFYGRLKHPLQEIGRGDVGVWLAAHPTGRVVTYLNSADEAEKARPLFWQPYLEGAVLLLDAESAARLPGKSQ